MADFAAAVKLDPEYALVFNNRGGAWAAKGDDEKALADFNEPLRLDPKETMALLNRAAIWRDATPTSSSATSTKPSASAQSIAPWPSKSPGSR